MGKLKMHDLTAIILCGGKGLRLRPITNDTPKPLIDINNKPILSYVIKHLRKHGINKFLMVAGGLDKVIRYCRHGAVSDWFRPVS